MNSDRYFTECPLCQNRVALSLAAKLRAAWHRPVWDCECGHTWEIYPEQIFRSDESVEESVSPDREHPGPPHYVEQRVVLPTYQPPGIAQFDQRLDHDKAMPHDLKVSALNFTGGR